jgi:hypothetical protein
MWSGQKCFMWSYVVLKWSELRWRSWGQNVFIPFFQLIFWFYFVSLYICMFVCFECFCLNFVNFIFFFMLQRMIISLETPNYWRNAFKCACMWKETIFSIDYEQVLFCIVPGRCICYAQRPKTLNERIKQPERVVIVSFYSRDTM